MAKPEPCVLLISPGIIKWTDMDFGLPHLVSMGGYVQEHTGVRVELLDQILLRNRVCNRCGEFRVVAVRHDVDAVGRANPASCRFFKKPCDNQIDLPALGFFR